MNSRRGGDSRGQVLMMVIVILVVMSTLVPLMVFFTQRESVWTASQAASTRAYHAAEAGMEKGFLQLSYTTATWADIQKGNIPASYRFDKLYSDVPGGQYAISISSGPEDQQAIVVSVGRDSRKREIRVIKAVYANSTLGNIAILGVNGINVSGNNLSVEWGSLVSPQAITPNGANHPSYWSSDNIVGFDTNTATPPNCDSPNCWWWHSFNPNIPPTPTVDFDFYKSSAIASGATPCPAGTHSDITTYYYTCSTCTLPGTPCTDLSGKPYYVERSWPSFDGPIKGAVIIMGNMDTGNGVLHGQTINAKIPRQAWKQYCNDWSYYLSNYNTDSWLTSHYPTSCPGLYGAYLSPAAMTKSISPVVEGLLYVNGNFIGPQGGGNTDMVYGVIFVKGFVSLNSNSHVKVYYSSDASTALHTTRVVVVRQSWQELPPFWPSGLP